MDRFCITTDIHTHTRSFIRDFGVLCAGTATLSRTRLHSWCLLRFTPFHMVSSPGFARTKPVRFS